MSMRDCDLESGVKIAISGKGGVGKTTICAIWAHLFAEEGFEVIAVDADSDANLAGAFGLPKEKSPEPLIHMKLLIAERTGTGKDAVGAYFKLNPDVSDLPEKFCMSIPLPASADKNGSLKILSLGGITRAGAGCACPEGAFLKAMLSHSIIRRDEVILVDLAAGVEFMGRLSVQGIDALVIVVEPGNRSMETALNVKNMARQMGVKYVAAIVNKVNDENQHKTIQSYLKDMDILTAIDYHSEVQQADLLRENVYQACPKLVEQLREAKYRLSIAMDEIQV